MMTVHEVCAQTGVSVRTLHHYDRIGLLKPTAVTEAGYRLYDDTALERLQQILLFRELEFPLKEISRILESPGFDRGKALEQQIELLTLKRERLTRLIDFACELKMTGGVNLNFSAFDTAQQDAYAAQVRAAWGETEAYREYERRSAGRSPEETRDISQGLLSLFVRFGQLRTHPAGASEVQKQVRTLQAYITDHFYNCTPEILSGLGELYAAGGEFTENIDRTGGTGTAAFAAEAIRIYCRKA